MLEVLFTGPCSAFLRVQGCLQDFKAAHLLGVCPKAQFWAMLIGSGASIWVSVAAYQLYTAAWPLFGPELPCPTARVWLDMAQLVRLWCLPQTNSSAGQCVQHLHPVQLSGCGHKGKLLSLMWLALAVCCKAAPSVLQKAGCDVTQHASFLCLQQQGAMCSKQHL